MFSSTLTSAGWNTRVLNGDLTEEVTALKREPGQDLLLNGGARLAAAMTERGLIDEFQVIVHPVVLGGGRPLLAHPAERVNLELIDTQTFDRRTVLLRYLPSTVDSNLEG